MAGLREQLLDWGVAARALAGETESGDRHLVRPLPDGALVAVVDGLGHGAEAAAAAQAATAVLQGFAHEPLPALVRRCHEELKKTRGVVLSLAAFDARDHTLAWLGVGNVDGVLLRADSAARPARDSLLLRGGVVGHLLPPLRAAVHSVARGDLLLLATDGIAEGFADALALDDPPQRIADQILAQHGKGTDDALVLVARYLGGAP